MTDTSPSSDDFALYVHWPFCLNKCPYCDFNSQASGVVDQEPWRTALVREMDRQAQLLEDRPRVLSSLYFGGGTPSLMEAQTVQAVIEKAAALWPVSGDLEISLEVNPASIGFDGLSDLKKAGINRLSVGVQALDDGALTQLGRRHCVQDSLEVLEAARSLFDQVSMDLIYARPGQTASQWEAELARLLDIKPTHLSVYQLSVEPGTPMFGGVASGAVILPDEDLSTDLFLVTRDVLRSAGLLAYEVSNHAREGHACRHNMTTWRGGDYLGIGPGAHGRLTTPQGPMATVALKDPARWCARVLDGANPMEEESLLDRRDRAIEMMMTGLRLKEGVSESRLIQRTGFEFSDLLDIDGVSMAVDMGLVTLDEDHLKTTDTGVLVLNALTASLLTL